MLKTLVLVVLAALALAVGLLLAYASTRPDSFRVERSTDIQAPPERIFALINDLKGFNSWNPYEKKDPAIKGEYSPVTVGPGARYGWESKEVGVGSLEIMEAVAPVRVAMKLDFVKPFEAHNQALFTLTPAPGGGTRVQWAMEGPSPFPSKVMGVVFNMDKMIGSDFEAGLASLKTIAEKP